MSESYEEMSIVQLERELTRLDAEAKTRFKQLPVKRQALLQRGFIDCRTEDYERVVSALKRQRTLDSKSNLELCKWNF